MPRQGNADIRYIVRLAGNGLAGWQLRLPSLAGVRRPTIYFSDQLFGGSEAALAAAQTRRSFELPVLPSAPHPVVHRTNSRSASGLVGVTLSARGSGNSPRLHWYWEAYWSENRYQRKKRFAVSQLGLLPAWEAAVHCRMQKTGVKFSTAQLEHGKQQCYRLWEEKAESGTRGLR